MNMTTNAVNHQAIDIATGSVIPSTGYCDQPYVVKLYGGSWLCTMTTGSGDEGESGQHVAATRSLDRGQTWSPLVAIEPPDGPEASWAMPYLTSYGRVYVFYTYNAANMREVIAETPYASKRVDTLASMPLNFLTMAASPGRRGGGLYLSVKPPLTGKTPMPVKSVSFGE